MKKDVWHLKRLESLVMFFLQTLLCLKLPCGWDPNSGVQEQREKRSGIPYVPTHEDILKPLGSR